MGTYWWNQIVKEVPTHENEMGPYMAICGMIGGFFLFPACVLCVHAIWKNRIETVFDDQMKEGFLDNEYTIGTERDADLVISSSVENENYEEYITRQHPLRN